MPHDPPSQTAYRRYFWKYTFKSTCNGTSGLIVRTRRNPASQTI